ncbi:hypothetical protein LCGC14_1762840 [marine sediment metagenome]|uniref:Polysaccharide pyruvyl transferase domain-containing protein n=1 Tax=marine sediment metagenome TaxID=412755 RepID=A0A0F9K055_9ZZZZ
MKAALVNDTSGERHVGCNAVIAAIRGVAAMHGIEIIKSYTRSEIINDACYFTGADIIIINGEGSLHHGTPNSAFLWTVLNHAQMNNIPTVLINTVWDGMELDDRQLELLNTLELVSCRESKSLYQIYDVYKERMAWVTPDMIFAHHPRDISAAPQKEGLVYCPGSGKLTAQIAQRKPNILIQRHTGAPSFEEFCSELTNYDGVVTDRFHTCCIAMMCGLPVYALKANCHKVDGLAEDSQAFNVYETVEMAENAPGDTSIDAGLAYVDMAREEIHELFYAIKECV